MIKLKKKIEVFILVVLILTLSVGYSTLSTNLDINGNINVAGGEYDVTIKNTSTTTSTNSFNIKLNGTNTFTVTPLSGYYLDSITCTNGYTVSGFETGKEAKGKQTVIINNNNQKSSSVCTAVSKYGLCEYEPGKTWEFGYTGTYDKFEAKCDGNYKFELWGAQGGGKGIYTGGLGAYTNGNLNLSKNQKLFLIVGGQGGLPINSSNRIGGFNGGGGTYGSPSGNIYYNIAGTGGGATDVRTEEPTIIYDSTHVTYTTSANNLYSRIMVAAGGGGGTSGNIDGWKSDGYGGSAGGLTGYNGMGTYYGSAKQTIGGSQTNGGSGQIVTTGHAGVYVNAGLGFGGAQGWAPWGGGGSGYYGGGGGGGWSGAGAGGSSFISGHSGCNAMNSSGTHTGQPNHYSGLVFTDTIMVDGAGYSWTNVKGAQTGMPTHDGTSTMTGNVGNGYAKITYLGN